MEIKIISYFCAIITTLYLMMPVPTKLEANNAIKKIDTIYVIPPTDSLLTHDIENKKRNLALLQSEVNIQLAEIRLKINDNAK